MNEPDNNPNSAKDAIDEILGDKDNGIELPENESDQQSTEASENPEAEVKEEPVPLTPEEEIEKWKEVAARSQADLENFRKRMARDKTEAIQYANTSLLMSLFPVMDNFEMGLQAAKNDDEGSIIYQGMAMVFKQINDFLTENKVETIDSETGTAFDPNLHEALKQENSDTVPEGQILYTMRRGYRLKDRLLRAANVVVSNGPETAEPAATTESTEPPA